MNYNEKTKALRQAALNPEAAGEYKKLLDANAEIPVSLKSPRLVNSFSIGCDPEAALVGPTGNAVMGEDFLPRAFNTAFGVDGSSRPIEIRPAPNRSAVKVVAGILEILRWMAMYRPMMLKYEWQTGGFKGNMPLGGHIHFGRVTDHYTRIREVKALDNLCRDLTALGFFEDVATRRNSNSSGYGRYSDYRAQGFGYEYRTPPSWLHSPRLVHFILTMAKLVVKDPEIMQDYTSSDYMPLCRPRISNILNYFRYFDDDAAIAAKNFPKLQEAPLRSNFKPAWGIPNSVGWSPWTSHQPPIELQPQDETIRDAFESIRSGVPPAWREPQEQMNRYKLPVEMARILQQVNIESLGLRHMLTFMNVKLTASPSYRGSADGLTKFYLPLAFIGALTRKEAREFREALTRNGMKMHFTQPQQNNYLEFTVGYNAVYQQNRLKATFKHLAKSFLPYQEVLEFDEKFFKNWGKRLKSVGLEAR